MESMMTMMRVGVASSQFQCLNSCLLFFLGLPVLIYVALIIEGEEEEDEEDFDEEEDDDDDEDEVEGEEDDEDGSGEDEVRVDFMC